MQRPHEYEDLITKKFFKAVPATAGASDAFLKNAQDYLHACKLLQEGFPVPAFSLAYDGLSQLFQAIFSHYEVQVKPSLRSSATQVICRELGMNISDQCFVSTIHERRNQTSYQSPFPPALPYEIENLVRILETYIPKAYKVLNRPPSSTQA
jgi:actin-related protein